MVDTKQVETIIEHPLEEVFDIEAGTTVVTRTEAIPAPVVATEIYDEKDIEVEGQFQEVYEAAMTAFEATTNSIETIEPKFRARNEEVAVQYLTTALAAANAKAVVKQHKDKLVVAQAKATTPHTVNQNLIVDDRNNILRALLTQKKEQNK